MTWTTPALAVSGDTLTAAFWNAQVKGNLEHLAGSTSGGWASYTPTWTASVTNPTIGNGTLTGAYQVFAKTVFARMLCKIGSTTTLGSGNYSWTLPVTALSVGSTWPAGEALVWYAAAGEPRFSAGSFVPYLGTTTTFLVAVGHASGSPLRHNLPTWGTGDYVHALLVYEAA